MRYEKIRKFDVSNAPGVRTTIFVTGCTHKCKGCFNEGIQDFSTGKEWTKDDEDRFIEYTSNPNIVGVNILGGEPMQQIMDDSMVNLLKRIKKETNKDIWIWSGYTFEEIISDSRRLSILELTDVLVDGRFDISQRNINLKYRGSENQRVLDVHKSLEANKPISYNLD